MKQRLDSFVNTLRSAAGASWFRTAILVLFAVQAVFLACTMHVNTPPDEQNHIEFIEYYANHSLGPIFNEQTPTWNLGDKTREIDYLYHYATSFVARALPGETADVYAIRLLSVVTAILTFLVLIRVFERLRIGAAATNVTLAVLTNLPMVLMLSAAVNNDVLVWLSTVLGVLLLLRLWREPRWLDAILLLNVTVLGGMVKRTMLPVSLALGLALIVIVIRKWAQFKTTIIWKDWRVITALVVLVVGSGLFIERVGGNMIRYHSPTPSCEMVQGEQACSAFWVNSRKAWLDQLGDDMPAENEWLGDSTKDSPLRPLPIFAVQWFDESIYNIVDIQSQGWQHKVGPMPWVVPLLGLLLVVGVVYGTVRDVRRKTYARIAVSGLSLAIIAMQLAVNYQTYTHEHVYGLGLNGRYILPAILLLAGITSFYYTKMVGKRMQCLLAIVAIASVVIGAGLLMMVRNPQLFHG